MNNFSNTNLSMDHFWKLLEKEWNPINSLNHTTTRNNRNYVIQYLNSSMESDIKELCPQIPPNLGELFYLNLILPII